MNGLSSYVLICPYCRSDASTRILVNILEVSWWFVKDNKSTWSIQCTERTCRCFIVARFYPGKSGDVTKVSLD